MRNIDLVLLTAILACLIEFTQSLCNAPQFWNPLNNACVNRCPWDYPNLYYADTSTGMCVLTCPTTPSLYANDLTQACVPTCPWNPANVSEQTFYDDVYRKCTLQCPSNPSRYKSFDTTASGRRCLQYCDGTSFALDTNRSCVATCPSFYFVNSTLAATDRKCVARCPNNTFVDDPSTKNCVRAQACPGARVGDPYTGTCTSSCSTTPSGQTFSDINPSVKLCVFVCPTNYYIQNITGNYTCVQSCLASYFIDYVTMRCVLNCPNGTFSFTNGTCLNSCPSGSFGDPLLNKCDSSCSGTLFSDPPTKMCVSSCSYGYFADVTGGRRCLQQCSDITQFGHPLTRFCVTSTACTAPYLFADSFSRQCVIRCPESQDTFGYGNECTGNCPWNSSASIFTYRDPSTQMCVTSCPANPSLYRFNGTTSPVTPARCVSACPSPLFAVESTRLCEVACPNNFFEDAASRKCVSRCPQTPSATYFFENGTSDVCVQTCPGSTLADPTTLSCITTLCPSNPALFKSGNRCVSTCPNGTFQNTGNRQCVPACTGSLNADSSTRRCVAVCPTNPSLFAHNNVCIPQCPDTWFSNNQSRVCTQSCNTSIGQVAYGPTRMCVLVCLNDTYAYNGVCVPSCPNSTAPFFYIDLTTVSCVQNCPDYYFKDNFLGKCVLENGCSDGLYADHSIRQCVQQCNSSVSIYRDDTTMRCVDQCPFGTFGDYSNVSAKVCNLTCPPGRYQDNSTWTCVVQCPTFPSYYADTRLGKCLDRCRIQMNQYADDGDRTCKPQCPNGTYADNFTRRCLSVCLLTPSTYTFVNGTEGTCVLECPFGHFADNSTRSCVPDCPSNPNYFADWETKTCVSLCPGTPVKKMYADNYTRTCVQDCPTALNGTYRDPILRICMPVCSGQQFADNSTGDCVPVCPSNPDLFGQVDIKTCVYFCDRSQDLFADNATRRCVKTCPAGSFADPRSGRCVRDCPLAAGALLDLYADSSTHQCVPRCPLHPAYYADNLTQQCVSICPNQTYGTPVTRVCEVPQDCPTDYFADPFSKLCVLKCPPTQQTYADNTTKRCERTCNGTFADNSTYTCVSRCPSTPSYFGHENKCLASCPNNTYADLFTRLCLPSIQCNNNTFGDPTSQTCVGTCPFGLFADPTPATRMCVAMCPQGLYADDSTKTCVDKCPLLNKTYGSNDTNRCVEVCPFGQYADNVTRMCVFGCPDGTFADYNVRVCVADCSATPNLYGLGVPNNTCVEVCPSSPDLYADNSTRRCVTDCPFNQSTFADRLTRRCVLTCPVAGFTFADNQTRRCEPICFFNPGVNKTYADNSSLTCVRKCPSNPDYYAYYDGSAGVCLPFCPNNTVPRTYRDNTTRVCEAVCNWTTFYYSDNTTGGCFSQCPGGYFADDQSQSCVSRCSGSNAIYNYGLEINRTCVSLCSDGWFAQNSSRLCVSYCPLGQYQDSTKRRCVARCDGQLRQYADNSTNKCTRYCSEALQMFADNTTYQCVSACPPHYWASNYTQRECVQSCAPMYADNYTGRCVWDCPVNLFTYADNFTYTCVAMCPDENITGNFSTATFADDSTKTCVFSCPTLPWTYAENDTRQCVFRCPNNTFGENTTRRCVANCETWGTYGDPYTSFCVRNCPVNSFADNRTDMCVPQCPPGTYGDNSTWTCVLRCPENPALYAETTERICVINCPDSFYGDDLFRVCTDTCPISPVYYAYDLTRRCFKDCLFPFFGRVETFNGVTRGICTQNCLSGEYKNMTTHKCEPCLPECLTCVSYLGCLSCQLNFFLFNGTCKAGCSVASVANGTCISDCPFNFVTGLITYASNDSRSCVETCPPGRYGLNSTLWCISSCPVNFYPSEVTRRCELCINGCINCTNATFCFNCSEAFLFSNNQCIRKCSTTLPFYYGSSCIAGCIDGTFLMSDRVTCNNCSRACATCSITASNCTRCVGAFLYNFNCVSKCPTNFYANTNLACVPCTSTTPECNVEPLRYTLQTFSSNGELYGVLTFNREVFMDVSRIREIINITLNGVPSTSYDWTASRINTTSYKININSRVSLNEMSLSLVFLNPNLVVDSMGTIIDATSIVSPLPSFDYISPEVQASTLGISSFSGVISYVALAILLILLFKGSYPLLLVFEVFQNIYFHYFIIADLPFNYSNFLLNLKFLNFQFLPSLFNLMIPSTYASAATPQKYKTAITDTTFFISSGHYFLVIAFYVLWAVVVALLKSKQVNKFKKLRRFARGVYENRIRFGAINECIWYCFMTFTLFGLWQLYDTTFPYTWNYPNFIVAIICSLMCIGMTGWVIHLTLSYRHNFDELPKKYNFILGDDSHLPYQMPLRYIRKLLLCLFLLTAMIELQVVGMIAANFIVLAFYVIYRPSKSMFNNIINIIIELCYIGLQLAIIFYVNQLEIDTDGKLAYGVGMIVLSSIALVTILVWLIWQFLQFLYDFKFIRDIVEETKVANKIYPEEDNLKIEFDKEYQKDEIVSHLSGISASEDASQSYDNETIVGIERQYENIFHYDEKNARAEQPDNTKGFEIAKNGKKNDNRPDSSSSGKTKSPQRRLTSSRNSSRMLFADINIEDLE